MSIFDDWDKTRTDLLEGLSPAKTTMVGLILDNQKKSLEAEYIKFGPAREFNAARKVRIKQMRIKRNLINSRRKALGLKPYRPKISVFPKVLRIAHDLPKIRRIIPYFMASDIIPEFPAPENVAHIFEMRINRGMKNA